MLKSILQSRWLVFQNEEILLLGHHNAMLQEEEVRPLIYSFTRYFPLGVSENTQYFCAELDPTYVIPPIWQAMPLRQALALMHREHFGLAVKSSSILNWDRHHQYCGSCGGKTQQSKQDFERICPKCTLSFFPRIAPSVVVLIRKEDHVLMARSPHFPPGVFGLIAGFVDSGESLEEAVHREVKEEVGITIKQVTYVQSQPWPFPDSLMAAFTADYDSGEITIDNDEIIEANWYRYDRLPGLPSLQYSIAFTLLNEFITSCS